MVDEQGEHPDYTEWPTKAEVAARTGLSTTSIWRLHKAGRLNPKKVHGVNRYNPEEVSAILADPHSDDTPGPPLDPEERRDAFAQYELATVRSLLAIVKEPRERIDDILFGIIDRLETKVALLDTKLEGQRKELEEARDGTSERNVAVQMMQSESRVKELAGMRAVDTVARLLGGSTTGVQLAPQQWLDLLTLDHNVPAGEKPFLTAEQTKQGQHIVMAWKADEEKKARDAVAKAGVTVVPSPAPSPVTPPSGPAQ